MARRVSAVHFRFMANTLRKASVTSAPSGGPSSGARKRDAHDTPPIERSDWVRRGDRACCLNRLRWTDLNGAPHAGQGSAWVRGVSPPWREESGVRGFAERLREVSQSRGHVLGLDAEAEPEVARRFKKPSRHNGGFVPAESIVQEIAGGFVSETRENDDGSRRDDAFEQVGVLAKKGVDEAQAGLDQGSRARLEGAQAPEGCHRDRLA